MISDDDNRWHYLAVKSLPALLRGITSNHHGDFYCLNCFHSYTAHNKLKKHERVCNNHDYRRVDMPKDHEKIKYLPRKRSLKVPFVIYADLECLLEKVQYCQNDLENSCTEKEAKHKPSGYHGVQYARLMIQKTDAIFIGEKFCKDLKELKTEIINFEEKEMIPLTNKEIKPYEKQNVCHICKEKFCNNKNKKKVRDHCHYTGKLRGAAHSEYNLRYKVPKEIPVVFHNGSTYDYHFIIQKLAEEFEIEFECLGENAEKYITFLVSLKKENDNGKKITYKSMVKKSHAN